MSNLLATWIYVGGVAESFFNSGRGVMDALSWPIGLGFYLAAHAVQPLTFG